MAVTSHLRGDIIVISTSGKYPAEDLEHGVLNALNGHAKEGLRYLLFDLRQSESLHTRSDKDLRRIAKLRNWN